MTRYICKCGRVVHKSTNADNTGNRETDGCEGCPYLLPWGPMVWDDQHKAYTQDVKGHECRMSPTLEYTSTYHGRADDKCSLRIVSLDLDFLDEVQAWIYEHAADTLTAGFSRGSIRGIEFSDKGRYSLSVLCAQNKKGMAAKTALIEHFFGPDKHRLDMTPQQEKAHILAAIEDGKARAQKKEEKSLTYRDPSTGWLYRVSPEPYQGFYWVYYLDPKSSVIWKRCTGAVLCAGSLKKEVEEEYLRLNAKRSGWELVADEPDANPTSSAVVTAAADQTAAARAASDLASMTEATAVSSNDLHDTAVGSNLAGAGGLPSFDYSGLDDQTVAVLHMAEREIGEARRDYIARLAQAVCIAHDALCGGVVQNLDNSKHGNRGDEAFVSWCASVGLKRSTAYNLLQVNALLSSSTPEEQEVLEAASPSLLYAAAKPSAPAELVQAVKDGDITTHKQYQELLEKYKAEQQAHRAERESTSALLRDEQQRRQKADEARIMAEKKVQQYLEIKDAALETAKQQRVKAADAEARAIAAEKKARELESRPVEVAVQEPTEEQIAAAAKQRTAMLEAQVRSLQADKDSALRQLDELGNTAYMAAAEFADNAARTVDSIRTAFWALAKELSEDDFADALAPLDEAVRKIYEREWDDEESEA